MKRKVSLKALDYQKVEEASGATARQLVKLVAGISTEKATELNKHIKGLGLKGVQSQVQGEQLRVTGKKRDDLQAVIAALKEHDFGIPSSSQLPGPRAHLRGSHDRCLARAVERSLVVAASGCRCRGRLLRWNMSTLRRSSSNARRRSKPKCRSSSDRVLLERRVTAP